MMAAPMLLSLPAGVVADRMGKRRVILAVKWLEVALLLAGSSLLYLRTSGVLTPMAVLVLLGVQAVFLSPARYGILPELLPHERLSAGNGLIELVKPLALVSGVCRWDRPHARRWTALAGRVVACQVCRPRA